MDRLLASPRYGERWGRHWMDIWRYSDWYGFGSQIRNSQPHIWHWRDWIIESLNQDKGYDRMIVEMLAADELAPIDLNTLRATGYLARNWYRFNRNVWLQETVEHTAAGFLGITLKCARCHDHKYDPIAQEEYYRFRAFFEPYDVRLDRVPGEPDLASTEFHGPMTQSLVKPPTRNLSFRASIPRPIVSFAVMNSPDKDHPLSPGRPGNPGEPASRFSRSSCPEASFPALRTYVQEDARQARKEDREGRSEPGESQGRSGETQRRLASCRLIAGGPVTSAAAHPEALRLRVRVPTRRLCQRNQTDPREKLSLLPQAANAKSGLALDTWNRSGKAAN